MNISGKEYLPFGDSLISPQSIVELLQMKSEGLINEYGVKRISAILYENGKRLKERLK